MPNSFTLNGKVFGTIQDYGFVLRCGSGNFTCYSDGKCIPLSKLCDFKSDCTDKSDEQVSYCKNPDMCDDKTEFRCQIYGKCILKSSLNDGKPDCPDGEDERDNSDMSLSNFILTSVYCTVTVNCKSNDLC